MSKRKVIIADDHDIFNLGLRVALEKDPFYEVIAEAKTGEELLKIGKVKTCDLVISDYMLPKRNGLDVLLELKKNKPYLKTILISTLEKIELQNLCIKNKIDAYLFKSEARDKIVETANAIFMNKTFRPFRIEESKTHPLSGLTKKELEVLHLWYSGKTLNETASIMHINTKTVESHRANIKKKANGLSKSEIFSLMKDYDFC